MRNFTEEIVSEQSILSMNSTRLLILCLVCKGATPRRETSTIKWCTRHSSSISNYISCLSNLKSRHPLLGAYL